MPTGSLQNAEDLLKAAKKASKKSWFSNPEWEIAGQYYEKAGENQRAFDSFVQSAEAYNKVSLIYFSAKSHESAGKIAEKKLSDYKAASEHYQMASDLYLATGNMPDRAAELMNDAGRVTASFDVERAVQLYLNSLSIYETENRGRFGINSFKSITGFLAKNKKYDTAVEVMMRLAKQCIKLNNKQELNRTYLTVIILLLAKNDDIEAFKQLDQFSQDMSFLKSQEYEAADGALKAYKDFDQGMLDEALKNSVFYELNSEIQNTVYSLTVPGFSRNVLGVDSNDFRKSITTKIQKEHDENVKEGNDQTDYTNDDMLL
ncbi:hypothetical protein BB559_001056 [Furculomyces boomerangus]|uniref:Gamma-soluble NSF attachment protein n=2 Tax=Harpellales TaxID=61421 RepID=A0A2T9Z357_9FUNG|nr:hypothetical protein BB559_001056 [Furculomyces boomerangus]PVZ98300.1 hypothetical protein BB558_005699 [Smittium angustum]